MMTFYFKTRTGNVFSAIAKDADRARCIAKKNAGNAWDPSAKLFKIGNAI